MTDTSDLPRVWLGWRGEQGQEYVAAAFATELDAQAALKVGHVEHVDAVPLRVYQAGERAVPVGWVTFLTHLDPVTGEPMYEQEMSVVEMRWHHPDDRELFDSLNVPQSEAYATRWGRVLTVDCVEVRVSGEEGDATAALFADLVAESAARIVAGRPAVSDEPAPALKAV